MTAQRLPEPSLVCAYCEGPAEGDWSIHRDGFGEGPEVELCEHCAAYPSPTAAEIWERIADRRVDT